MWIRQFWPAYAAILLFASLGEAKPSRVGPGTQVALSWDARYVAFSSDASPLEPR
jgi:hypothetical protein